MPIDLTQAAAEIRNGRLSALAELEQAIAQGSEPANHHAFIRRFDAAARAAASAMDTLRKAAAPLHMASRRGKFLSSARGCGAEFRA